MNQSIKDIYNRYVYGRKLFYMIEKSETILELGCGRQSLIAKHGVPKRKKVDAIDIYAPYIIGNANKGYRHLSQCDILKYQPEKHYDLVVLMDVIEHLDKEQVINTGLLNKLKTWGNRVIITVLNGYDDNVVTDENPYQVHRSGWIKEDFIKYGYKVRGTSGYWRLRTTGSQLKYKPEYITGIISLLTELPCYFLPSKAFCLLVTHGENVCLKNGG